MSFTIPNAAEPGKKIVAQKYNDNNTAIANAINQNASDIDTINIELPNFIQKNGSVPFTQNLSYELGTITGATNATPIVITEVGHNYSNNDSVLIVGITGNTAANSLWTVTKQGPDTYSLNNSVGNGAYVSGGNSYRCPNSKENIVSQAYVDYSDKIGGEIIPLGTVLANFTLTIDRIHIADISTSCTLSLPSASGSTTQYKTCLIDFSLASSASLTLPTVGTNFKWKYGQVPTINTTSGVRNQLFFESFNGGTTWYGSYVQIGA